MIGLAKAALNKNEALFTKKIGCQFKAETSEMIHLEHNLDTGTWTPQEVDKKYLGNFEMWCHRRMEKTSCTDRVKSEEVLCRVEARNTCLP
jgi:hypothetical protein